MPSRRNFLAYLASLAALWPFDQLRLGELMTDTDNLDDLANAIANSSPKIKAYAVAQAAATQSQELDIRDALARIAVLESSPDPEPAPVPSTLPFSEASLRTGYETITVPQGSNAGSSSQAVNGGEDCLVDLQRLARTQRVTVWTKGGQRIRVIGGRSEVTVRSVDGIGAEHVSIRDVRFRSNGLIDGLIVSGNPGSPATTFTYLECRVDTPSVNVAASAEHIDSIQVQGDLKRLEIGMSTIWLTGVSGGDRGKGLMLNTISKLPFEVDLDHVNYRAADLLTGAAIFKDYTAIAMRTNEVYFDKQGASGNQWGTSGAFYPTATFSGDTASWPASVNWQGVVKRGLPPGGDFCLAA